jgi:hypothetical protein
MKYNPHEHFPEIEPCSRCRSRLANGAPQIKNCRACEANAKVAIHLWLERTKEEQAKWLGLHQFQFALYRVSKWIGEPDTTAISQMIDAAADRPLHPHGKEKTDGK